MKRPLWQTISLFGYHCFYRSADDLLMYTHTVLNLHEHRHRCSSYDPQPLQLRYFLRREGGKLRIQTRLHLFIGKMR